MVFGPRVGDLIEPLTGRHWDPETIRERWARRLAVYQANGLRPGDRVFLHFGNTCEFFVELLAIWQLGGCVAPIDPRLTPFEVEMLSRWACPRFAVWLESPGDAVMSAVGSPGVTALVVASEDRERAAAAPAEWRPLALDQDALILFTSGTTGSPKGVVHTHGSLRARWMSLYRALGVAAMRRTLCLLPTHFGHGLICNALFPWLFEQDLYIGPSFKPDLLTRLGLLIDEHRITFMSSVPAMWRLAIKTSRPPRTESLRRIVCGSAPLTGALWKEVQSWTGTTDVLNAYGITETASWLAGTTVDGFVPADGLIGEPWGAAVKILGGGAAPTADTSEVCRVGEPGRIWVKTAALMRGYLDRDDLTREVVSDGWFATGDIGYVDDRGLLYLSGREREEINKGGVKVYPGDIDAVVERFPAIVDACSFGYEDPLYGENVGIAVVASPATAATLAEAYEWTRHRLAAHQMPVRWYLVDEISRTARGKVNRASVAGHCAALTPIRIGATAIRASQ
jgi:acyl-CoA synthetase (AMP-forming)/AMP-acid ligase II